MSSFNKTLVIIPTYNEIHNVEKMIRTISDKYEGISILIIDDASPDGTGNQVKELQGEFQNLHLLSRDGKYGLGTAYVEGFKWALEREFDFVVQMDCDFSHDPNDIGRLQEKLADADMVVGSRYNGAVRIVNWPLYRLVLSYGASLYTKLITGLPIFDATSGFKCHSRKALEGIDLDSIFSNGYSFQIEMNYRAWIRGLKIIEEPIIFTERRDGQSKLGWKIIIEAVFAVWKLRFLGIRLLYATGRKKRK